MGIEQKVLSMRFNEFGFSKICFLGSKTDVFPNRFHIVKWVETEPMEVYSMDEKKMVRRNSYCYAIGELEWDDHEPCWDFRSIGTRYLEDGTEELNKWILDFCKKYKVENGRLTECSEDCSH